QAIRPTMCYIHPSFCRRKSPIIMSLVARTTALIFALSLAQPAALSAAAESEFACSKPLKPSELPDVLPAVEKRYQGIQSINARFVQKSLFVGLDKRETSKGEVFFRKPGRMDWIYQQPEEQRFVSDGSSLWFYQPTLNQVTVGEFKNSFNSDLPVTF